MFNADQKYTKETRGPKSINYLLFICFCWGFFFNAFLKKNPFRNIHKPSFYNNCRFWHKRGQRGGGELNFFNFHPILMHLSLQSVHLDELLVDLKQGSKGVSNSTFRIFERFVAFLFLFQFWRDFVIVEWIVFRAFDSMSTDCISLLRFPR